MFLVKLEAALVPICFPFLHFLHVTPRLLLLTFYITDTQKLWFEKYRPISYFDTAGLHTGCNHFKPVNRWPLNNCIVQIDHPCLDHPLRYCNILIVVSHDKDEIDRLSQFYIRWVIFWVYEIMLRSMSEKKRDMTRMTPTAVIK